MADTQVQYLFWGKQRTPNGNNLKKGDTLRKEADYVQRTNSGITWEIM